MKKGPGYWIRFVLRWTVAVAGLAWVLSNLHLSDRLTALDPATGLPVSYILKNTQATEDDPLFTVTHPDTGQEVIVPRSLLVSKPDRTDVTLRPDSPIAPGQTLPVLATRPLTDKDLSRQPTEILVQAPTTPQWITPDQIDGGYQVRVPYPPLEVGLWRMVERAEPIYFWAAICIFPVTFLVTSFRWYLLLRVLGIAIPLRRAVTLNLVGQFYSSFMPGITGGDVLKAYYAAKNTTLRTGAVLSVVVDRGIGLLALVILGGACAAVRWDIPECRTVAMAAGLLVGITLTGALVFYVLPLRRALGLDFLLKKLPMQSQVVKATQALEIYGKKPALILGALVMTFPVHGTVIVSAYLAGTALQLPLEWWYYWVIVPTIVLSGSLPLSPQGAGVMEFFAIILTRQQGLTVSQAFALTMSIRLLQLFWNLLAGIMVLRGGYSVPRQLEEPPSLTPSSHGTSSPDSPVSAQPVQ